MDALDRITRLHADGAQIAEQITRAIAAETAELDAQIRVGETFILSTPTTVTRQVDRERAWTLRISALVKLILRRPGQDLHTLLEEVLKTRIGQMPLLVSTTELEELRGAYRPCGTCQPPVEGRAHEDVEIRHFGVAVRPGARGLTIDREMYAQIDNRSSFFPGTHSEEWCTQHQIRALENYDHNMRFFSKLNWDEFDTELQRILTLDTRFKEITDLKVIDGVEGVYIMVLDDYRQAYVGLSSNMKLRIRQHWWRRMPFDRLIFGSVESSVLSIDSFRAHDTTRIFAVHTTQTEALEERLVEAANPDYLLNRDAGGGNYLRLIGNVISGSIKQRKF
jgi:hypothetical protein